MKPFFGALIIFCVCALSSFPARAQEDVHIAGDVWCPLTCEEGDRPGYFIELAQMALQGHPIKVHYHVVNWARAVRDARRGAYDAIAGASYADAPEFIFPSNPQLYVGFEYFALARQKWKFVGNPEGHKIGIVNGYNYDDVSNMLIKKYKRNYFAVSGEKGLTSLIPMLNLGRVDAVLEAKSVFYEALRQQKLKPTDYKSIGQASSEMVKHFIAFSPKYAEADQVKKWLEEGQLRLEKSGELKKLKSKYGLN